MRSYKNLNISYIIYIFLFICTVSSRGYSDIDDFQGQKLGTSDFQLESYAQSFFQIITTGNFVILTSDGDTGNLTTYLLVDDHANTKKLWIDDPLLAKYGGALKFNGKRVKVSIIPGAKLDKERKTFSFNSNDWNLVTTLEIIESANQKTEKKLMVAEENSSVKLGSKAFLTILCKFADYPNTEPAPITFYKEMYDGPNGLNNYWKEQSHDAMNLSGSRVIGWYTLPNTRSYYVDDESHWVRDSLLTDCLSLVDSEVFFPDFYGINLQFNENTWYNHATLNNSMILSLDNIEKAYSISWLNHQSHYGSYLFVPNQSIPVYAHEMGHMLGLLHSSGPCSINYAYDSLWDVMSGGGSVHTISYHKDLLGWIPETRKWKPGKSIGNTFLIDSLAMPQNSTSFLMGEIPITGLTDEKYTVELRRFGGYDTNLPAEGVIIHHIIENRSNCQREGCTGPAEVVDSDGNCDPNDAGAVWLPGERFSDSINGISITINSEDNNKFRITFQRPVKSIPGLPWLQLLLE